MAGEHVAASGEQRALPAELDTTVAHPARVYDYWLGGKDNFAADREAAERVLEATPGLRMRVRANRAFLARVVRFLAGEAGIRQFLDIGTGIPTANNTHEVAAPSTTCRRICASRRRSSQAPRAPSNSSGPSLSCCSGSCT